MNSRRCKRSGSAEDALLSFVEVKEEPNEQLFDYNDLLQQAEVVGKSSESVNKYVWVIQKLRTAIWPIIIK